MADINNIKSIIDSIRNSELTVSEANFLRDLSDVLRNCSANFDFKDKTNQRRLKDVFAKRLHSIIDTERDYMYNFGLINEGWIKLSKSIASLAGETYLSFLYPTVKNRISQTGKRVLEVYEHPRDLLLMDSGTTLWPIDEIDDAIDDVVNEAIKMEHKGLFVCEFYAVGSYKKRALTPRELFRLMDERRGDPIKPTITKLKRLISTKWLKSGSFPAILFPECIDILQYYFDIGSKNNFSQVASDYADFKKLVEKLLDKLNYCYIEDVYNLYAQQLNRTDKGDQTKIVYLYELLFKWINSDFLGMKTQMEALASLLFELNPSYVFESSHLESLYTPKQPKATFYHARLLNCIDKLKHQNHREYGDISAGLDELKQMVLREKTITKEAIEKLKKIYSHRWDIIKSSNASYLHRQSKENEKNKYWIYTLQLLKGAGHIEGSIYQVLMPDLIISKIEPISYQPIDYYPLSYYVLSEDKKSLVCLYNSEQMYLSTGTFYNCDGAVRIPFTEDQLKFIHDYSDTRFKAMANEARSELKNRPIRYSTVKMLRQLVNNSLFENSLVVKRELSAEQQTRAECAWTKFICLQLEQLEPEERNNLLDHSVMKDGVLRTVRRLIDELKGKGNEYDACVGRVTSFIARLVCDYDTTNYFDSLIELSPIVGAKSLRSESAFCVFSEQKNITEDVASHRIKLLMIALMTNNFSARSEHEKLSWWDINSFGGNDKTCQLGEMIKHWIQNNGKHARHVYANIMECVVRPHVQRPEKSVDKKSIVDNRLRWNVDELFELTLDEGLFSSSEGRHVHVCYYDYKLVFSCLLSLYASTNGDELVKNFLDELVNTCLEDVPELARIIRINILLNRLFHEVSAEQHKQICDLIVKANKPVTAGQFVENATNYVSKEKFYELIYDFLGARVLESRKITSWWLPWSLFKYSLHEDFSASYFSKHKPTNFSSFGSVREVMVKFLSILPLSMSSDAKLPKLLKSVSSSVENAKGAHSNGLGLR